MASIFIASIFIFYLHYYTWNKTCVYETRMPPAVTKSNMAKISKSYILTPPQPQGHVMSVKCKEPIDETYSPSLVTVSSPKL